MAFNINAAVILSGPKNLKSITSKIKSAIGNTTVNININVPKNVAKQLNTLSNQINVLNQNNAKLNTTAAQTSSKLNNVGKSGKEAANAMQVLGKETALTFKRFAAAGLVTATFFRLTQAISEAVPKALEFEREMVKIQQVTGGTTSALNGLNVAATNLAKNLGLDANEIISVGRVFAQTGQTLDEVESSMRAVARASLAPSFGDMQSSAEGLIASLNQFNIAASESEAVLGAINAVSKKFAVESQDIIAAIRRVGGVFAIAATDAEKPQEALNQLIAIFTSVRSTTRESSETIATGLRTIFSRIQRPKTIEFLKQLGINLRDADGNFVGLFSSFRILSKELDGIIARGDTLALSKVVEELGGIRQVGKLIPAIKEFRKAEAAFNVAQEGAVQGLGKDVATGLTPLIKTFEQIQARFQALIKTVSESSTFQMLAKIVAGMANAFLGLAEALVPILPALTAIAAVKIGKGIGSFAQGFFGSASAGGGVGGAGSALGSAVTGGNSKAVVAANSGLVAAIAPLTAAVTPLAGAITPLTGAITPLTAAVTPLHAAITPLNSAIPLLTGAINRLIPAMGARASFAPVGRPGGGRPGRPPRGFARGGIVPGSGNGDTVPAMLSPGEFVIKKSAVGAFGAENLSSINRYTTGTGKQGVKKNLANPVQRAVVTIPRGQVAGLFMEQGTRNSSDLKSYSKDLDANTQDGRTFIQRLQNQNVSGSKNLSLLDTGKDSLDTLNFKFGVTGGFADEKAVDFINVDVIGALEKKLKDDVLELTEKIGIPGLTEDAQVVADKALEKVDLDSLKGHLFEALIQKSTGALLTSTGATYDFENLDTDLREKMNALFTPNVGDATVAEAKKLSNNKAYDSGKGSILGKLLTGTARDLPSGVTASVSSSVSTPKPQKKAAGGSISGTDTIPALLTPGEFVVNSDSAKAFGYGNLNNINKYADGGVVQRFAKGTTGSGARPRGGGGGGVNAAATTKSLKNLTGASKALTSATGGVKQAFGELAGGGLNTAIALSFIPGAVEQTIASLGKIAAGEGSSGDVLGIVTNIALIGSSLSGLGKVTKGLTKKFKSAKGPLSSFTNNVKAGAKVQGRLISSKGGIAVPGRKGFKTRATAGKFGAGSNIGRGIGAGFEKGGFKGAVSGGFRAGQRKVAAGAANLTRKGTQKLASVAPKALQGTVQAAGKGIAKSVVKGVSGGLPGVVAGIIAAVAVDPIASAAAKLLGASDKETIVPGVEGRREGAGRQELLLLILWAGAAEGALTGAAIGSLLAPLTGGLSVAVGAAIGAALGALESAIYSIGAQAEFDAFVRLEKASDKAVNELNTLSNASLLTSSNLSRANASTTATFAAFDGAMEASAFKASADELARMFDPFAGIGDAFDLIFSPIDTLTAKFTNLSNNFDIAGNIVANFAEDITGVDFGSFGGFINSLPLFSFEKGGLSEADAAANKKRRAGESREADSGDLERENVTKALSGMTEEFFAATSEAFSNTIGLASDTLANIDLGALEDMSSLGLAMETASDGVVTFTGNQANLIASLEEAGQKIGQGSEIVKAYANAVRASALESAKASIDAAKEQLEAQREMGGEGWFWDSDEFNKAEESLRTAQDSARTIAELGDNIGGADVSEIESTMTDLGISSDEARKKILENIQANQAKISAEVRVTAATAALKKVTDDAARQIEALGEGLLKLENITGQAANRFSEFVGGFANDFDRAFGSDAILSLGPQINPFENLDTSTPDEIAAGLENIKAAIGDVGGGPNEGATQGFQETLQSTKDLPFAIKGAMQDIVGAEGGREFASGADASAAILKQLEARGSAPTGAAKEILVKNIEAQFNKRQAEGGGGAVAITEDLLTGVASQIGEMGTKLQEALSSTAESLNVYKNAQLSLAQFEIDLVNKRKETANKLLDIEERRAKFLGTDKGKDPLQVAQRNLDARLGATQTGVQGMTFDRDTGQVDAAGNPIRRSVTLNTQTTGAGLQGNRDLLQKRRDEIQKKVDEAEGPVDQDLINELAAVESALAGTKQSLDTLADDTTKLAAIQKNMEAIEKRKLSAQDRLLVLQGELAAAMESGDTAKVAEILAKMEAPRRALAKAQAGEALTLQESNDLAQGRDQLVTEGLITPQQAAELGNTIAAGFVNNPNVGSFLGGQGTINGAPAADFLTSENSLGGGAMVGVNTAEQTGLQAQSAAILDEQSQIVEDKQTNAEAQAAAAKAKLVAEAERAKKAFLDAGAALDRLRHSSELLVNPNPNPGQPPPQNQQQMQDEFFRQEAQDAVDRGDATPQQQQLLLTSVDTLSQQINNLASNGINMRTTVGPVEAVLNTNNAGGIMNEAMNHVALQNIMEQIPIVQEQIQQAAQSQLNTA